MELELLRTYLPKGTNGQLFLNGSAICATIELPWKNNAAQVSCIPEGRYVLKQRYSPKFGQHLILLHVKGRSFILIHPANDALKELRGCIAPVSVLTGAGRGSSSRAALKKLLGSLPLPDSSVTIYLTIRKA